MCWSTFEPPVPTLYSPLGGGRIKPSVRFHPDNDLFGLAAVAARLPTPRCEPHAMALSAVDMLCTNDDCHRTVVRNS